MATKLQDNSPATKSDLDNVKSELKSEIGSVRSELKSEIKSVRSGMAKMYLNLDTKIDKSVEAIEKKADERQSVVMTFLDKVMKELREIRSNTEVQTQDHSRLVDIEVKLDNHLASHP